MASLKEKDFELKVTRIQRKSIDRLAKFADSELEINHRKLVSSMGGKDEDVDIAAFHSVYIDAPQIAFSLYALAIIHCYSIVENNRKLIICRRIPDLTERKKKRLHIIGEINDCLNSVDVSHEQVRCYKTMEEFRTVNNKIKHDRYSLSTSITTNNQKKYGPKQLRSLYSNKARHLETYLSDLYRRVRA